MYEIVDCQGIANSSGRYWLHPGITSMAVNWWKLAEDGQTSLTLVCGWENFCETRNVPNTSFSCNNSSSIYIIFPVSACKVNKSGYMDFECNSDMVLAHCFLGSRLGRQQHETFGNTIGFCSKYSVPFSHVGGRKVSPRMVRNWLPRSILLKRGVHSESLVDATKIIGALVVSLSKIHAEIFRNATLKRSHLTLPSIVQTLLQAKVTHLSFYRAQAECTRCFCFLITHDLYDQNT